MIILLDTSSATTHLTLVQGDDHDDYQWESGRELAKGLLAYLRDTLAKHDATFQDISGIGVMKGPGSFTGLRIGITVCNTLAHELHVPIVGVSGDDWRQTALQRLSVGENDNIILPKYGGEANITKPRK